MLTLRENSFSRSFELMENMSAEIINSQDVCLFKETGLNTSASLNLRHLPSGSYRLLLLSEDEKLIESHQVQIVK